MVGFVGRNATEGQRQRDKLMLQEPILQYLEKLNLFNLDARLTETIFLLLSSPSIKYVDIYDFPSFTGDLWQRATNSHAFPNRVSFKMSHCKLATHKILDILLQDNTSHHLNKIMLEWVQKEPANFNQIVDKWRMEKMKKRWVVKISIHF